MGADMEEELMKMWGMITELSEQMQNNRHLATTLQNQASQLRGQATHAGTGFVLRRFNTDISKEVFESELERMNAQLVIENQQLQHENKQLNSLLKEYEQTLETVMAKFRSQAHAAQQHELTLTRHYETLLLSRESQSSTNDLSTNTAYSASLSRLSELLRMTLRSLGGEDPESTQPDPNEPSLSDDNAPGYSGTSGREDWALDREIEIARLEQENEELRKLLGISGSSTAPPGAVEELKDWDRPMRHEFSGIREMHHRKGNSTGSSMRGLGATSLGNNTFHLQRVPSMLARDREPGNGNPENMPMRINPSPRFDIDEAPGLHDAFKRS
jgi:hypothetical protein